MSGSKSRRQQQQQQRRSNVQLVERQPSPSREQELEETIQRVEAMLYEARNSARGQITKSMAWDESEALGIPSTARRINNLSDKEYKDTLCKAYVNMPWIAACIDARVLRLVSGTWELEPTCEDADEDVRDEILKLLLYVNDDEDLMQLLYSYGLDMMIYGEAFIEIVREKDGNPESPIQSLHKIDCQTMVFDLDDHGNISLYKQLLTHQTQPIDLETYRVVRAWFPSPESSKKALSPIAKLMNSAMLYEQMMEWARSFFKKGARPPFSFEHPGDKRQADEFLLWLKENFTGKQNAHIPLMTYDGVKMQYAPSGPIELDFLKGLEWVRQETLSNLQTPPATIAIAQTGALSQDTGDSQSKQFLNNAVKPLDRLMMEKINYAIIRKGFHTDQWKLVLHPASYADDEAVAKLEDMRIRNGSSTPNESRVAQGKVKYKGMGDTPVIVTTKEVTALATLDNLEAEHDQTTALQMQQAQAQLDVTKAQAEKLKEPPPPPPAPVQPQPPTIPPEQAQNANGKVGKAPQEHYTNDLRDATLRVNETLVRADEQLRHIREKQTTFMTAQQAREWFEQTLPRPPEEDRDAQGIVANEDEPENVVALADNEEVDPARSSKTEELIQLLHQQMDLHRRDVLSKRNEFPQELISQATMAREEAETPPQTGIMIAFMLDADTAKHLAIPGGEDPDDMHCTLAFMGNIDDEAEPGKLHPVQSLGVLTNTLSLFASTAPPLHGNIGGLARFSPSPSSDEMSPVVALVNVAEIQSWRQRLVDLLSVNGFVVAANFAYLPHITLTYIDADKPMPINTVEPLSLDFDTLCLAIGDQRTYFKLGSDDSTPESSNETQGETHEEPMEEQHPEATGDDEHSDIGTDERSDIGSENNGAGEPTKAHSRTPRTELTRWRTRAVRDSRAGRSLRPFESDILDVRRIADLQIRLEGTASEETIRAIFKDAIEAIGTPESIDKKKSTKSGWRPPSEAQIDLEAKVAKEIKAFIATAKISKEGIVLPNEQAHEYLQNALYDALVAANHEGTAIMQGAEESIVSAAKNLAGHAVEVIGDIIAQIKEKVQGIIDAVLGNEDIDPAEVEQEIEKEVEMWSSDYSNLVAQSEIHTAVQRATLDAMKNQGVEMVDIHNEPGACLQCKANAAGSPYPIDEAYQYLDQHPFCQCTARETNKEK